MEQEASLYKEKLALVNGKIELIRIKENLVNDKFNELKRKSMEKMEINVNKPEKKQKLNKNEISEYDVCFNYTEGEERSFLPTVKVNIENNNNLIQNVRGFIDTGAQPHLVSHDLFSKRNSFTLPTARRIVGVNGDPFVIKKKIVLKIYPWYATDKSEFLQETFWILPRNSGWQAVMPQTILDTSTHENKSNVPWADPEYWRPNIVQILFGASFLAKIIISVVDRNVNGTALLETTVGVIIFGSHTSQVDDGVRGLYSAIEYNENEQLDKLLERMWRYDQIDFRSELTEEEKLVENHFMETHKRDKTGRFVVEMILKENVGDIGSSREIALRRFMFLERRLSKNPEMRQIYVEKMREYIQIGDMVLANARPRVGDLVYYIPHHCVPKDNRIVYDASCKTDKGVSLNDIQMKGAKLQKDLFITIMRFRRHRVAIYSDIKRMYLQVKLAPHQWDLQRIFWRENPNQPLREYWLTKVIFGEKLSPFMAVRSVIQCAREASVKYPKAAQTIENDFYMDDCVTGDSSEDKAIQLAMEMDVILKGGGFELRKWQSNSNALVRAMKSENEDCVIFSEEEKTTVLGLKWLINEDKFTFVVKNPEIAVNTTKRKVVSCVAQIYDPNGYISPVIMKGKFLIQDLWRLKIDWDEKLPEDLEEKWREFWSDIIYLENFTIDRWLKTGEKPKIQIHGFSDSGEPGLGAVIYVRVEHPNGKVTCNLITSKSRVTPLKTMTMPRLELSAAELLSRLVKEVKESMEWPDADYVLWVDSSAVFFWIRKVPREMKTFVANRVSSIQSNTDINCWRHINGKENPADLLTRGISAQELVDNKLWLHGPEWLLLSEEQWPKSKVMKEISEQITNEVKVHTFSRFKDTLRIGLEGGNTNVPFMEYVDTLERAVNILSYVQRFIKLCPNRKERLNRRPQRGVIQIKVNPPTLEEKAGAMQYLLRKAQQEYFNKELTALNLGKGVPEKSPIESLNPILDRNGLLRVGGRLERSELNYEMKHPVIIPHDSRLAWLLADNAHRKTKHGGVQVMTQFIRQTYWIPKLRNLLRSFTHKCTTCVRISARVNEQMMGDLPSERVQIGKPFLHTGVDYAGPFEIKMVDGDFKKVWVSIFVCVKTRAVHIDLVTDLSGVAFIACYERFVARRGRCERMISDNGGPFTATSKELKKALKAWTEKNMIDHLHNRGTSWHFVPPAAPHQGGIYEAAVKSMKFHLKRIIGVKKLNYENFITILTQIEAILNSRPLHQLSDDPTDIQALTPGHFLVGEPLILPLPFDIDERPQTKGVRLWRDRQNMIKHFWQRWQEEYLTTLQERKKWRQEKENLKVGQLVLLKSENYPPASWALGRIKELLPSKDGLVRSVIVQTQTNQLKRAVQKLCILPIEPE